jgi:hypothetical protein
VRWPARLPSILWMSWLAASAFGCAGSNPDFNRDGPGPEVQFPSDGPPAQDGPRVQDGPPVQDASPAADVTVDRAPDVGPGPADAAADSNGLQLQNGLVGHWPMEEGQGTGFEDRGSRANDGTVTGAAWARPGAPAPALGTACLDFNGGTGAQAPARGLPALGAAMTVSLWMRPKFSATRTIFTLQREGNGNNPNTGFQIGTKDTQAAFWLYGSPSVEIVSQALTADVWYHLAYTFDGSTHRLFVNAAAVGSSTAAAPTGTPTMVYFGSYGSTIAQLYIGRLDDVRLYDRVLTAAEIRALAKP